MSTREQNNHRHKRKRKRERGKKKRKTIAYCCLLIKNRKMKIQNIA